MTMECSSSYEDLQKDLQEAHREMLEAEIKLLALQRTAKANVLGPSLKKKLLFLISMRNDVSKLQLQHGSEINLLGLSKEMCSQLTNLNFTSNELHLIKEKCLKELHKVTKEVSDSVVEFNTEITLESDVCKVAQDLQKLGMDINAEMENLVECQNKLIDLKYKTILGSQLKKFEMSEKELINTSQLASDLYEKTLKAVYPSTDYQDKLKIAASCFEKELSKVNKELEDLQTTQEMYKQLDQQEFKSILSHYKEVTREIKMREMALKELKCLDGD